MQHLLFLYFILVYTVGFGALVVVFTVYARTRAMPVLAYGIFYLAFTLKVVVTGLKVYAGLNLLDAGILPSLNAVDEWVTLFFACTIPILVRRMFGSPRLRYFEWGFVAAAIALLLYGAFPGTGGILPAYLLLAAASLYSLVVSIVFMDETRSLLSGAARILVIGLAVFIPLIFLPVFLEPFLPPSLRTIPAQLLTFPLFYCYHGILFAGYFMRTDLGEQRSSGRDAGAVEKALSDRGLSAREVEVVQLVGAGASNRLIGERLFISVPTVKKHVHNAFGKLGIRTRYQLIHLLSSRPAHRATGPGKEKL